MIKSSRWMIQKNFFEVELVPDFGKKLREYTIENEVLKDGEFEKYYNKDNEYEDFVEHITSLKTVLLYQFPFPYDSNNCKTINYEFDADYFEKIDDNWAIPRSLFIVKE